MEIFTGALRDPRDTRDKLFDHIALAASPFDWVKGCDIEEELGLKLPVKQQGRSWSCVAQAVASYTFVKNCIELKKVYRDTLPDFVVELSAKSVYSQINLGIMKGAYLRDGVKLIVNYGINKEAEVTSEPDENKMVSRDWMTPELTEKAKNYQSSEYRVIQGNNLDTVAQAIRDNHGVLIGFNGENNGSWFDVMPKPPKNIEWGHAMYAGKARVMNGKRYIGCLNSWGENAGEKGWQWFGEEWFKTGNVFNPWTIVDKANLEWVKFIDKDGRVRTFPMYFLKTIRLFEKKGYKFL